MTSHLSEEWTVDALLPLCSGSSRGSVPLPTSDAFWASAIHDCTNPHHDHSYLSMRYWGLDGDVWILAEPPKLIQKGVITSRSSSEAAAVEKLRRRASNVAGLSQRLRELVISALQHPTLHFVERSALLKYTALFVWGGVCLDALDMKLVTSVGS